MQAVTQNNLGAENIEELIDHCFKTTDSGTPQQQGECFSITSYGSMPQNDMSSNHKSKSVYTCFKWQLQGSEKPADIASCLCSLVAHSFERWLR